MESQVLTQPEKIKQMHLRIQRLLSAARLSEASSLCLELLRLDSKHADAHFLLGVTLFEKGQIQKTIELIEKSIELDGQRAEYYAYLAKCYVLTKEDQKASDACAVAMSLKPTDALTIDTLGNVYSRLSDHQKAAEVFRQAISIKPNNADFHYNLASSLRFLGDFEGAEASYEAAIAIDAQHYKSHSALATLKKQTHDTNHIERLERVIDATDATKSKQVMHLRYALSKEYEDVKNFDRSFANLKCANDLHRGLLNYSIDDDVELFDQIKNICNENFLSGLHGGYSTQEPVFVVGMPRTGTTLVERILSSHSKVSSAGELQNFGLMLKKHSHYESNRVLDIGTLESAKSIDFGSLGRSYIESTRQLTGNTPYFVDKLPMNFLYIGFIALALPGAKIICLRRNAMDACFSNYKQLFTIGYSYYNYSYDLKDVARYYLLFEQLMQYWHSVLPGRILDVHYESLVENQVDESHRIIDWCGLDWEEACLSFYENQSPVSTASAVQVRQPMYKTSIGRWKKYREYLKPLEQILSEGGINVNE